MTQEQLIDEIKRLPLEQRVELLELISHSVLEDMRPSARGGSLAERLRGIARFDGEPPTDEELKKMYADYLSEKYS
jgi:hypothetical protein